MNKKEFVKNLYQSVIIENSSIYYDLFTKSNPDEVKDLYWKEAIKFFLNLSDENKSIFFKILKQIEIDTVSNILGLLDGIVTIKGDDIKFKVLIEGKDTPINGDLQELFLEYDENNR